MEQNLKKSINQLKYEPTEGLAENIWKRLMLRNKRIVRIKITSFSIIGIASIFGLVPAFKMLSTDLSQSGFYEYLSIAFSSNNSIAMYWKEFMFSIVESLPIMSTTLLLGIVFILFTSIRYTTKQIIRGQLAMSF